MVETQAKREKSFITWEVEKKMRGFRDIKVSGYVDSRGVAIEQRRGKSGSA